MLHAEGNANDGDAEQQAEDQMGQGDFPSEDQDPQDVHEKSSHSEVADFHVLAKGPQDEEADLDALDAKGDTDDGDAE